MTTTHSLPAGDSQTRPAGPPVTVQQVVDGDTYSVQLTLAPDQIIKTLADTLIGYHGALVLVAHLAPDNPEHIRARRELVALLAGTFTVALTPEQASVVESGLYYATDEPNRCTHCRQFASVVVEGDNLCDRCARALDQVNRIDREA